MTGLIKIDVAAHLLGKPAGAIFDLVDGAGLLGPSVAGPSLVWVFDLSAGEVRRDLRLWADEVMVLQTGDAARYAGWQLPHVLAQILPEKRQNFHAGEVDQLFQIRPRTRIDLLDSAGVIAGRNFYTRKMLVDFLEKRWLTSVMKGKQ